MNHQLFEEWIIDETSLDQEQKLILADHLATCQSCTRLTQSWQAVQHLMKVTSLQIPNPGFAQRWQTQLANMKARQQRRFAWWIFGTFLGLALIALAIITLPAITSLSLDGILVTLLFQVTLLIVRLNHARELISLLFGGVSPVIPLTIWVLAASSLTLLCFLWIFSIWKLIIPKGVRS